MTTSIKVVHANHTEDFEWLSACCGRTAVDEIEEMCSGSVSYTHLRAHET